MRRGIFTSIKSVFNKLTVPTKRFTFIKAVGSQSGPISVISVPDSQDLQYLPKEKIDEFLMANPHHGPNQISSAKDDFRSVLEPAKIGPQIDEQDSLTFQVVHRVSVRSVLEAVNTTQSYEMSCGELDLLNTTHSSYINSEVLSND